MNSRPPTPPYVPFGIRRFNRISARTRTGQGCCSILPVRVFLLRSLSGHDRSLPCASSPSGNYSPPMLAIPVFPVASSCSLWSWVSSTVSRYSFCSDGEAAHPISALLSSCSLSRSSMISCLHCKMGGLYLVSCILYLVSSSPFFPLCAKFPAVVAAGNCLFLIISRRSWRRR